MDIIYLLAPIALLLAVGAIIGFLWAVNKGQYDDLETPAHRMLLDDEDESDESKEKTKDNNTNTDQS